MFIITLLSSTSIIDKKVDQITKTHLVTGRTGISASVRCPQSPLFPYFIMFNYQCNALFWGGGGGQELNTAPASLTQCLFANEKKAQLEPGSRNWIQALPALSAGYLCAECKLGDCVAVLVLMLPHTASLNPSAWTKFLL